MKLLTEKGNCGALKIIIASTITGVKLNVEIVGKSGGHVRLPRLVVSSETTFFSSNASIWYLYSLAGKEIKKSDDPFLDWESSQLQPIVANFIQQLVTKNSIEAGQKRALEECFDKLEKSLEATSFLGGNEVSLADVSSWSTLFPVLTEEKLTQDIHKPALLKWFTSCFNLPAFKEALSVIVNGKGLEACKDSFLTLPPLQLTCAGAGKAEASTKNSQETEAAKEKEIPVTPEELEAVANAWIKGSNEAKASITPDYPILPKVGERNVLITSALPYVNNVPHLGNIIGCVLSADVFARFCRLRGYRTLYICGTDEYGTATETKALEEKMTPREICDKYFNLHDEVYKWFDISFDHFGRTTTEHQTKIAQDIFWRLHENGFLCEDSVEQLLCQTCDRFLADRFVEGICPLCGFDDARGDQCDKCGKLINAVELKNPRCKVCSTTPVVRTSTHLFLDLPKIEGKLHAWMESASQGWTHNARVIAKSWVKEGLKPRCITRDLKWGTPVPLEGFTDKVFYVWFDAPIGYVSITAAYTEHWEKWWKNPQYVTHYEFMAKDNVPFHSVVFPSTQLGTQENFTMVNHLMATEYLNYEDGKFSKSRGVGVFGNDAKDTGIPADVWRFYLLYIRPETQDSCFSWSDLMTKTNSELLNNLGNFINRGLSFLDKSYGGIIPRMELNESDKHLLALMTRELRSYLELLEKAKLRDSIRHILTISRLGNQHVQANQPWVLAKGTPDDKIRAGTILGLCANISALLSVLVQPYMPGISRAIQQQLQVPPTCNVLLSEIRCILPEGHKIGKPVPLFQKIDQSLIEDLKKRYAGKQQTDPAQPPSQPAQATPTADSEDLAKQVAVQGDCVRQLKAQKVEKSVVDVAVAKLLDLKKRLAAAEAQQHAKPSAENPSINLTAEALAAQVTAQGDTVRLLKSQKADKAIIEAAVAKLLDLKKQLALTEGKSPETAAAAVSSGKNKKKK